jgi:hypothetical protein
MGMAERGALPIDARKVRLLMIITPTNLHQASSSVHELSNAACSEVFLISLEHSESREASTSLNTISRPNLKPGVFPWQLQ